MFDSESLTVKEKINLGIRTSKLLVLFSANTKFALHCGGSLKNLSVYVTTEQVYRSLIIFSTTINIGRLLLLLYKHHDLQIIISREEGNLVSSLLLWNPSKPLLPRTCVIWKLNASGSFFIEVENIFLGGIKAFH